MNPFQQRRNIAAPINSNQLIIPKSIYSNSISNEYLRSISQPRNPHRANPNIQYQENTPRQKGFNLLERSMSKPLIEGRSFMNDNSRLNLFEKPSFIRNTPAQQRVNFDPHQYFKSPLISKSPSFLQGRNEKPS